MGEMVEFPSNGGTAQGYLAIPEAGRGPGLVVIQEWWGLVPHIKDVCDRFAAEGFLALAPDLFQGQTTTEPDEAAKLMMAIELDDAAREMGGAVRFVAGHEANAGGTVGVVGYCMGGGLALMLGCQGHEQIKAVVPYYGVIPWQGAQPDWSRMTAAVQGHYAENDEFADPESVRALEKTLRAKGVEVELYTYPDTGHAFFNDDRPEAYNEQAARQAWARTLDFLRARLA